MKKTKFITFSCLMGGVLVGTVFGAGDGEQDGRITTTLSSLPMETSFEWEAVPEGKSDLNNWVTAFFENTPQEQHVPKLARLIEKISNPQALEDFLQAIQTWELERWEEEGIAPTFLEEALSQIEAFPLEYLSPRKLSLRKYTCIRRLIEVGRTQQGQKEKGQNTPRKELEEKVSQKQIRSALVEELTKKGWELGWNQEAEQSINPFMDNETFAHLLTKLPHRSVIEAKTQQNTAPSTLSGANNPSEAAGHKRTQSEVDPESVSEAHRYAKRVRMMSGVASLQPEKLF